MPEPRTSYAALATRSHQEREMKYLRISEEQSRRYKHEDCCSDIDGLIPGVLEPSSAEENGVADEIFEVFAQTTFACTGLRGLFDRSRGRAGRRKPLMCPYVTATIMSLIPVLQREERKRRPVGADRLI